MTGRSFHDDYLRLTPMELVLPEGEGEEAWVTGVAEAVPSDVSVADELRAFVQLPLVARHLDRVLPEDADPVVTFQVQRLLLAAVRFRAAGGVADLLTVGAAREFVRASREAVRAAREPEGESGVTATGSPAPAATPRPQAPEGGSVGGAAGGGSQAGGAACAAGYLQLPRNLFWGSVGGVGSAPEPVDGVLWQEASGIASVLVALGMREGRPGLTLVPLEGVSMEDWDVWHATDPRPGASAFANVLPGGELDDLYSIETQGEILLIFARALELARRTGPVASSRAGSGPGAEAASGPGEAPASSRFLYRRHE